MKRGTDVEVLLFPVLISFHMAIILQVVTDRKMKLVS